MSSLARNLVRAFQLLQQLGGKPQASPKISSPSHTPPRTQQHPQTPQQQAYSPGYVARNTLIHLLQAQRIWLVCLMSIPLDLYLVFASLEFNQEVFTEDLFNKVLLIALGILFLTGSFEHLHRMLLTFRRIANTHTAGVFLITIVSTVGVVAVILWNLFINSDAGILPAIVLLLTIITGLPSFLSSMRKNKQHRTRLQQNRVYWVEQFNQNLLILRVTPFVVARVLTVTAALHTAAWDKGFGYYVLFAGLALMYLGFSRPTKEDFFSNCRKCRVPTSRIFSEFQGCPTCENQSFRPVRGGLREVLHTSPGNVPFRFRKTTKQNSRSTGVRGLTQAERNKRDKKEFLNRLARSLRP
jgi:hypothetical protein